MTGTTNLNTNSKLSDRTKPNFEHGTLVIFNLTNENESIYSWKATLQDTHENVIVVEITPSPNCIVAKWEFAIQYKSNNNNDVFHVDKPVYIIFNPWCPEDQVFMESDQWREEAILNSDSLIWQSPPPSHGTYWKYAQFDENILDCALYLIETVGKMKPNLRNDPVHITRTLSAVMNVQDDAGVLVGNWSNKFTGGTPPTQWTGSRDILQQYYDTKKPVKYGQCWVFAGILTTGNVFVFYFLDFMLNLLSFLQFVGRLGYPVARSLISTQVMTQIIQL